MDPSELYSKIATNIITVEQLHQSLTLLRQCKDNSYQKDINVKETIEKYLPYFLAESIFTMINEKSISFQDIPQIQKIIQELESHLEKLTIAEMEISYVPSYRHLQEIATWWSKYTGKHVVISIKINGSVIIGAKISYEGIYKDYSLETWLKQHPLSNIEQFNQS